MHCGAWKKVRLSGAQPSLSPAWARHLHKRSRRAPMVVRGLLVVVKRVVSSFDFFLLRLLLSHCVNKMSDKIAYTTPTKYCTYTRICHRRHRRRWSWSWSRGVILVSDTIKLRSCCCAKNQDIKRFSLLISKPDHINCFTHFGCCMTKEIEIIGSSRLASRDWL